MAVFMMQTMQLYHSVMWRWLDHPVSRSLSRVSYSLYLYHALAWSAMSRVLFLPLPLRMLVAVLSSLALGTRPGSWWRDRFSRCGRGGARRP